MESKEQGSQNSENIPAMQMCPFGASSSAQTSFAAIDLLVREMMSRLDQTHSWHSQWATVLSTMDNLVQEKTLNEQRMQGRVNVLESEVLTADIRIRHMASRYYDVALFWLLFVVCLLFVTLFVCLFRSVASCYRYYYL